MKQRIAGGLAAVLLLTLLTACGIGPPTPPTDGGQGPGNFPGKTTTTQGGTTAAFTRIPADFPLPVYPEWTVMAVANVGTGGGSRWSASFQFEGDVQGLVDRYADDLQALGYEVKITEVSATMFGMDVSSTLDGKPVEGLVSIGNAGGTNVINISFGDPL